MENNNELRPVLYIRDGKKVIEIEMYREQKYVVEFSYYQEDEEGWGSGTDEYLSREDLTNMAEGIRTIFRRERTALNTAAVPTFSGWAFLTTQMRTAILLQQRLRKRLNASITSQSLRTI